MGEHLAKPAKYLHTFLRNVVAFLNIRAATLSCSTSADALVCCAMPGKAEGQEGWDREVGRGLKGGMEPLE